MTPEQERALREADKLLAAIGRGMSGGGPYLWTTAVQQLLADALLAARAEGGQRCRWFDYDSNAGQSKQCERQAESCNEHLEHWAKKAEDLIEMVGHEPSYQRGVAEGERRVREALEPLLESAARSIEATIDDVGGCDHSVGICLCEDFRIAASLRESITGQGEPPDGPQPGDTVSDNDHLLCPGEDGGCFRGWNEGDCPGVTRQAGDSPEGE